MDIERFREACLALPRAVEEMPFGDDVLTLKVAGKCFAFVFLRGDDLDAYLKCEPEYAEQLRAHYEAITASTGIASTSTEASPRQSSYISFATPIGASWRV